MARGDQIRVHRFPGYRHHGIDCGDGTVIHYTGEPFQKRGACVRRTSLEEFAKGGRVEVVRRRHPVDPEAVIQRAESRLGETSYNLLWNNCEHFARWCETGESKSRQVRRVLRVAAGACVATGCVAGAIVARNLLAMGRRRLRT